MRALVILATVAGILVGGNLRAAAHDPVPAAPMPPMGSMASPAPVHAGHMAHMAVTDLRPERPGDRQRADAIVAGAKRAMARYPDVAAAEQAGFKKFLPDIPLPIEHYTSAAFAREQWGGQLDPEHPTSLIFERHGSDLALVGVMYTAAASVTPDRLDALVPMSIARWHRHVDYCFAPAGVRRDPRFGLGGTIASQPDCETAHGRWVPQIFGWMVHVWPAEHDPAQIWAVDRDDATGKPSMSHMTM